MTVFKNPFNFSRNRSLHVDKKKDLGKKGEELAVQFIRRQGFEILERNYHHRRGEIDIVARDRKTLVFIEVKTATSNQYGPPESWVDSRKQQQVAKIAAAYLQERKVTNVDCRFDVIAVDHTRENSINHIQNAFWIET
ncbi:MAG: YraN family protein [Gemmatimonadota bacterium]|nr:MAG: YraN family protein [Gemmatimonadota bacterium]